jgi:putative FmdB family regulatory protein
VRRGTTDERVNGAEPVPTYEYRCQQCDRTFDVVQSFSDDPLDACPTCGGPVKKVFGSVGIVFKGSGFYKTDSRASGAASTSSANPASGGGSGTDGSAPGSSEPAASPSPASSDSSSAPSPATTPAATTPAATTSAAS